MKALIKVLKYLMEFSLVHGVIWEKQIGFDCRKSEYLLLLLYDSVIITFCPYGWKFDKQ
jgi:hypothetical protein